MDNLVILIGIIPSIFVFIIVIKTIIDALKDECFYFVSYHWDSEKQSGHGSIEVPMHGSTIDSYDDIQEIKDYIEEHVTDYYNQKITVIILNFKKLDKGGSKGKNQHIFFTDNGIKVKRVNR